MWRKAKAIKANFGNADYRLGFKTLPPRGKERAMKVICSLLAGLVLVVAPIAADDDDRPGGGVCIGTMHVKACVPPDSEAP